MKARQVYIYLIPKSKWPKGKVLTMEMLCGTNVYMDYEAKTGKPLGIEVVDAFNIEVEGERV